MASFDYDVAIIDSGFGGSVAPAVKFEPDIPWSAALADVG
jgi:hypothetical protein